MVLWWMTALPAAAQQRPVTYAEALRASMANNGVVVGATYARDQAEAVVLAERGIFDPLYTLSATTTRQRYDGLNRDGFDFHSEEQLWTVATGVSGFAPTGTTWQASLSLTHDTALQDERVPYSAAHAAECFLDPTVGLCPTIVPSQLISDYYSAGLDASVSQELLKGIRYRYNLQNVTLARMALQQSELEVERQRQLSLYETAAAYWTWTYQHQLYENAVANVAVAEEALRVGRAQVERGQLAPVEVTRLEAALVQARQTVLDTNNLDQQAANAVLLRMGETPDQEIVPATPAGDVPVTDIEPTKAAEVALAQNLDLAIARHVLETERVNLANLEHATFPSLTGTLGGGLASWRCAGDLTPRAASAGGEAQRQDPVPGTPQGTCLPGGPVDALLGLGGKDFVSPYVTVGATFTVPIGNRAARGAKDGAAAALMQRERELQDLERQVQALVEEQVRALQSAKTRMELGDANLRLAEQTLAAEEALAAVGRSIQKTVLEARAAVQAALAEAAKSRTDYRLAQAQLLALQGQLTEETP